MKFEISGFYSSGAFFKLGLIYVVYHLSADVVYNVYQSWGPGRFYPPLDGPVC